LLCLLTTVVFHVNNIQVATATYVPRNAGLHVFLIPTTFVFIGDVVDIESDVVKQTGNTQVHYEVDAGYWSTYSDALFSAEEGLFDDTPDTNAYNLDLNFTPAIVSPDWDIMAVSSAALIGQASKSEAAWTRESTHLFEKFVVSTTANAWTEIARKPHDPDSWITGYARITARRTDLAGRLVMSSDFTVWRDGVAPVVASSDKYSQAGGHALMDFQVIGDGNDAVAQVKGFPGQDWEWELVYFTRDVV
jgi:hypothetical protein